MLGLLGVVLWAVAGAGLWLDPWLEPLLDPVFQVAPVFSLGAAKLPCPAVQLEALLPNPVPPAADFPAVVEPELALE